MPRTSEWCGRTGLFAVGPAALSLLLGLWGITRDNSMWRDEAATWQASHRTVPEIWHLLDRIDVVHGLYYLFMHEVFAVAGDSLVVLRLPSVLAMAAAAALITLLGARLAGRCAGLGAGLAFALIPAVQQYAQEGRPYALVTACAALACLLLVAGVERPGAGRWAAYGATVLIAALLNWFSLLMLCAHAVTIVLARPPRATVLRWAAAAACAVAGALPLVVASSAQSQQVAWIRPVTAGTLTGLLLTLAAGTLCAWAVRSAAAARRAAQAQFPPPPHSPSRSTPSPARLTLAAVGLPLLAVPPLVLLAASLFRPVYLTRYVLFSHLGLALLIGGACHALALRLRTPPRRTVAGVMTLAFLGLLPVQLSLRDATGRIDDVLATAASVAAAREDGDGVLYIPAARRDTALVSPVEFTGIRDLALVREPPGSGTMNGVEGSPDRIAHAMLAARRILVVSDVGAPPATTDRDRAKQRVLKAHFVRCSETVTGGRQVTVYERRSGEPAPGRHHAGARRSGQRP
ncbi:glycosyltransferase family 39 protein [Streptomyces sp. NBC_00338]|uniref:glycosyltransferase family 39 protein n=1 Tax=Streptomyces sp. NBC_00338 TaxID=2975715 RepID=UPI00225742FF|nr:glycosyltransferase family 39 protein [Streptomyces sp. NBC_00338]MCX5140920.1 glycosyltransferase family 39 protein [Streptomyces sp. NBC_00338]